VQADRALEAMHRCSKSIQIPNIQISNTCAQRTRELMAKYNPMSSLASVYIAAQTSLERLVN
jgi:hypothetical protein